MKKIDEEMILEENGQQQYSSETVRRRNTDESPRKTGSTSGKRRKKKKKKKRRINIHLILGGAMLLILIAVLIRFFIWNMGTHSGYDPNEVTDEFDTEALDYIQPLDPELLEGREDDGVTTILALGNDPFSDERGDEGIAELVADRLDAVVYNGAFPGSTIATKYEEYSNAYPLDGLSLYWVTAALANQNFELMNRVCADLGSESAAAAAETLNHVDMDKVDVITIMYDLQDYMGGRIVYDDTNENNINSCCGALNASIQLIQETWPHIRIIVLSHPYGTFTAGDGTVVDGDRDDLGNGTLTDYMGWEIQICVSNGVTFIDNYYGTITVDDTDLLVDGFHLTQEGRQKVADRIVDVLDGSAEK